MSMKKIAVGIILLLLATSISPLVIGDTSLQSTKPALDVELGQELDNLRYLCTSPIGFDEDKYNYLKNVLLQDSIIEGSSPLNTITSSAVNSIGKRDLIKMNSSFTMGLMNSSWPMKCHDTRHTAQSPYSTADNPHIEKWRFKTEWWDGTIESSPVISNDGTIYFGSMGTDHKLYAINPDGTKKWSYETGGLIWSTPALAGDGTIYVTSYDAKLHALFSSNGTLKWKVSCADPITSSPAIGDSGAIYFGVMGPDYAGRICAINPNGTEKWHYDTDYWITSDPAVGDDGTIYIGSGDSGMYAINPNGTLKWRFDTGGYIKGHPSIGEDGVIFFNSWDNYLYAVYPNGALKWGKNVGWGMSGSASIANDGTIYFFTDKVTAYYPNNGTVRWSLDVGGNGGQISPAISADGTIYVCNHEGKCIIAIDPNGHEIWREQISNLRVASSPIIAEDGTIYVGSSWKDNGGNWFGYLHAFGELDPNAPAAPSINGETNGEAGVEYNYTFRATDPNGDNVSYYIEWGDREFTDWIGPYQSGEDVIISHTWVEQDTYTIKARSKDINNLWGSWGELEVTMPVNQPYQFPFIQWLLERFPNAFPIMRQLVGL
jgi:outer membrane protein assembly factor BamB